MGRDCYVATMSGAASKENNNEGLLEVNPPNIPVRTVGGGQCSSMCYGGEIEIEGNA